MAMTDRPAGGPLPTAAGERRITLVAILTVRRQAISAFRTFERRGAAVMARHGGAIERTIAVPVEEGSGLFREIHLVTFPSAEALAAYRGDEALRELTSLRESSVVATEILIGEDGPDYGPPAL